MKVCLESSLFTTNGAPEKEGDYESPCNRNEKLPASTRNKHAAWSTVQPALCENLLSLSMEINM